MRPRILSCMRDSKQSKKKNTVHWRCTFASIALTHTLLVLSRAHCSSSPRPSVRLTCRRFPRLLGVFFGSEVRFRAFCLTPVVTNGTLGSPVNRSRTVGSSGHWYPDGGAGVSGDKQTSNPGVFRACSTQHRRKYLDRVHRC